MIDWLPLGRKRWPGSSGLGEVVTGEVRAVVDVKHVGDPVHHPSGVGLGPDRLPQSQGQVQGGRGAEEHGAPGDCPGVVVEDDG